MRRGGGGKVRRRWGGNTDESGWGQGKEEEGGRAVLLLSRGAEVVEVRGQPEPHGHHQDLLLLSHDNALSAAGQCCAHRRLVRREVEFV